MKLNSFFPDCWSSRTIGQGQFRALTLSWPLGQSTISGGVTLAQYKMNRAKVTPKSGVVTLAQHCLFPILVGHYIIS